MKQRIYLYWMASTGGISARNFMAIHSDYPDLEEIFLNPSLLSDYGISESICTRLEKRANMDIMLSEINIMKENKIHFVGIEDNKYPALLKEIYSPPIGLFVKGAIGRLSDKAFAVVGTRTPTRNAVHNVTKIARELSEAGVSIISGMARGIDAAAHTGALEGGTPTVAVLGCGVERIYPQDNMKIYEQIAETGAVISEYMVGTPPLAKLFPARNRIITGIARGVLIAEGSAKSGAAISARFAAEENRDVFAMPGDISSPQSALPNKLLVDGAYPACSAESILDVMGWPKKTSAAEKQKDIELDFLEKELYNLLIAGDLTISELSEMSKRRVSEITSAITSLELSGIVEKLPGNKVHICCR